jgi:hypothetical protein
MDQQTARFRSILSALPDGAQLPLWRAWSSASVSERGLMIATAQRLYDVEGMPARAGYPVRNAGHFDVGSYAEMARLQWAEIRERGLFRRKDAETLLAYWDKELARWYAEPGFLETLDHWILDQARVDDGEVRAWAQTRAEVKVRLPNPERTFEYRKEFETAIKRLAIYLDGKRGVTDKPNVFTLPLVPVPRPPPITLPPPAKQPEPETPARALAGMGVVLALALAAGAYFLLD